MKTEIGEGANTKDFWKNPPKRKRQFDCCGLNLFSIMNRLNKT